MDTARTILVPIDFSDSSLAAFAAAISLHGAPGTAIVVQHVIESDHLAFATDLGYGMPDEVHARARQHAEERLRRNTEADLPEGVEIERMVSVGRPVFEILRVAADLDVDLIVLGMPPVATDAQRALFGSVAEHVLRGARCPVLAIPGPQGVPAHAEPLEETPDSTSPSP